jgi:signal transduction histidine kinase
MRPFERAADRIARDVSGVGLGLPLASHLIALHGGELTIESSPGLGTTASVFLPADRILTPIITAA